MQIHTHTATRIHCTDLAEFQHTFKIFMQQNVLLVDTQNKRPNKLLHNNYITIT